ncbi:hypothetical protein MSPP1_003133 [Malassezia sp. CBS 17886]|nr:hypothetical protein MSPP1_003133 [Malassezia sp. CBS 17886]
MSGKKVNWGRALFFSSTIVVAGYALMKFTTPNADEYYNRLSPDLKKQVNVVRAARRETERQAEEQQRHLAQASTQETATPNWSR